MKRYKMRIGDLKVVDEHPAGDLISVKELSEKLKLKTGDKIDQDLINLIRDMVED